jgi:hypothetical protein
MIRYEDRCCGRFPAPPFGTSRPETTCTHDFFLVRVDSETGEVSYVKGLTGPVALSRLDVHMSEWHNGSFRTTPLPDWSLGRLLSRLHVEEMEFLRDEFLRVAESVERYPNAIDDNAMDLSDSIQDVIELHRHGRIVTGRITDE